MDIRKYFQAKAAPKRKVIDDDDEDDDVIPQSPDVQIINKAKKSKSDTTNKKSKLSLKQVDKTDLFGKGPIKRTEPIVKKAAKNTETGIHSDEEFEKSLLELDNLDEIDKIEHVNSTNDNKEGQKAKTEHSSTKDKNKHKDDSDKKDNKDKNEHVNSTKDNKEEQKTKTEQSSTKDKIKQKDESDKKDNQKSKDSKDKCPVKVKTPSPSKEKQSNKKTVENIKKEIKDTNKRKFEEFIDSDVKSEDSKTKIEDHGVKSVKKIKIETPNDSVHNDSKMDKNDTTFDDSVMDHDNSVASKKKRNKSFNESVLTDEERHERKMHSAALYQKYLNRSGPKHLGAKEMPEGEPNCLKDYAFLLTGVLDSFERDEVEDTIKKYGGTIKSGISKKVTHVLAGEDAGPAKTAKAQELGIPIINEDEFLQLIKDSTKSKTDRDRKPSKDKKERDKTPSKDKKERDKTLSKDKKERDKTTNGHVTKEDRGHKQKDDRDKSKNKSEIKKEYHKSTKNEIKESSYNHEKSYKEKERRTEKALVIKDEPSDKSNSVNKVYDVKKLEANVKSESGSKSSSEGHTSIDPCASMWVEKYKPQNLKQIIGQHGEASNVNKLINWLKKWYVNRKAKLPKPSPWAKNDDGGYFKAALLSGPPGVGKTTTVSLVCKELGFDMVEFNASDTRNKTLIKEQIGELLTTTSLSAFASGDLGKQAVSKKHVLVMDEVDGMAGNEDRGGLQELIVLIKSSSVPIICMCNDRNSQKMRSLVNYCYDLRFSRPRVDQIKAAMLSVCCKEHIKIPPNILAQLIVSANQDVRQTLNLLSMWAVDPSRMDPEKLSKDAAVGKKDVKLGPWEAIRKVFSAEDHKTMSINDKSDLFFYDYSLAPLFVQENYLQVQPHCPKHEVLERISAAADSIAFGDVIEARIRGSQAWSLLPMQAMFSSVIPGSALSGHVAGQIQFPGWLGKNSRKNKMHRLAQEIHAHTRLSTTGSKSSVFLDYAPHLRDAILNPLIKEKSDGIEKSLQVLEEYHLLREDLESLTELSLWPGQRNPSILVDSKIKAAMTRTYNKKATALPYAPGAIKKGRPKDDDDGDMMTEDNDDNDEGNDSDPENDALIKKKKSKESVKSSSSDKSDKPSTSKGKTSANKNGKGKKK